MSTLRTNFSRNTAYQTTARLRQILREVERHGGPHLRAQIARPRPRAIVPTEEELEALKQTAQPWERAWLILQAEMGLRISETLRVCDATHNRNEKTVTILTKGSKPRTLPTTAELEMLFALAPKAAEATPLLARLRGRPLTRQRMNRHWRSLVKRSGVRDELNPHDLRRRAAVRTYDQTKDIRAVQHLLGHDRLSSTLSYLEYYDSDNLRPLIEALQIPTEATQ